MATLHHASAGHGLSASAIGTRVARVPVLIWIWVATVIVTAFAPDLVTGSEQEHLPLVPLTAWIWAGIASAYLVLVPLAQRQSANVGWTVLAIWALVAVATVAGPVLETGSDPTTIPLLAVIAPVVGAIATGFVAVTAARRR